MLGSRLNRCSVKTVWSRGERWSRINYLLKLSFSTDPTTKVLYPLKSRSLVKVGGPEAGQFLQGLITNDIRHLEDGAQSMYAMFLNNKGRVLYDTLVHKWTGENIYMLECDKSVQNLLLKHLKIYKLKRDVQIGDVSHLFKVWALMGTPDLEVFCEPDMKLSMSVYKDPRLTELGHRLITTTDVGNFDIHSAIGKDTVIKGDEQGYHVLRYSLGVSEGAEDLFPGTCFPLEANCDYLHGISFHKGCYIGQELTARVHHTGVVRKRIMPIVFNNLSNEEELEKDATVWANVEPGRTKVGKIKSRIQDVGLGLVRIKEALDAKSLTVGQTPVTIKKPFWWPKEVTKEKFTQFKPEYEEIREK